jgi:hypothetical protein
MVIVETFITGVVFFNYNEFLELHVSLERDVEGNYKIIEAIYSENSHIGECFVDAMPLLNRLIKMNPTVEKKVVNDVVEYGFWHKEEFCV